MPWGGYQANMVLNVTDYVMFYGGAIWVPVGTFTWSVNAEIVWFGGGVQIFNVAGPSHTQFTPREYVAILERKRRQLSDLADELMRRLWPSKPVRQERTPSRP
jgi:hypothetical protein